jgi:hypothetical protein
MDCVDEHMFGLFVILGSTYTGHYRPVNEMCNVHLLSNTVAHLKNDPKLLICIALIEQLHAILNHTSHFDSAWSACATTAFQCMWWPGEFAVPDENGLEANTRVTTECIERPSHGQRLAAGVFRVLGHTERVSDPAAALERYCELNAPPADGLDFAYRTGVLGIRAELTQTQTRDARSPPAEPATTSVPLSRISVADITLYNSILLAPLTYNIEAAASTSQTHPFSRTYEVRVKLLVVSNCHHCNVYTSSQD